MKLLAIIPARGGSKRIPRKNIKEFCGFPIIKYSIEAALKSGCFNEVMVSTDDKEIADISKKFGATVPFYRSKETSNDYAGVTEVVAEVVNEYKKMKIEFDNICIILPTAPFITADRIKEGLRILSDANVSSVTAVVRYEYPIQRSLIVKDGYLFMMWPENYSKRSQDFEPVYHDVGQFYWIKTKDFFRQNKIFTDKNAYIEIPEIEVQDIDTEENWKLAELKYKIIKSDV